MGWGPFYLYIAGGWKKGGAREKFPPLLSLREPRAWDKHEGTKVVKRMF
jgi:hypothetical protein